MKKAEEICFSNIEKRDNLLFLLIHCYNLRDFIKHKKMSKFTTKLNALPKERLYIFIIGIIIVFGGIIGSFAPWFSALFGVLVGPFCILLGLYGGDPKKGMEELKHDLEDVKDSATHLAEKTVDVAGSTVKSGTEMAQKAMGKEEVKKSAPAKKALAKK